MLLNEVLKTLPESDAKKKIASETVPFRIQNVADYVWGNENTYEGHIEECFSYRLPFSLVWFEFREPEIYREGRTVEKILNRPLFGALTSIRDGRRFHLLFFMKMEAVYPQPVFMGELSLPLDEKYRALPGPYPIRAGAAYLEYYRDAICEEPEVAHRILSQRHHDLDFINNTKKGDLPGGSKLTDITMGTFPIITTALNFLHCKNVSITENHTPKKLIKANIRRGKERPYFERYYTLGIEPMKRVLDTEGKAQSVGVKKAFHICRGHFKTYDDKPLFGRLRGTFWTPAHIKGNIGRGIVRKDYEIKTDTNPAKEAHHAI